MFAIVGPFAEAVRVVAEPCSFLLVAPTLTALIAARAHWHALLAALVAGVVGGWILVDNRWILDGWRLQASAVLVVGLLAFLVFPSARIDGMRMDRSAPQAAAVGVITLIASLWWRPCVGVELGAILNGAQDGLAGQLLPMAAYMVGVLLPAAAVVAVRYAVEPSERLLRVAAAVSAAVGAVVALALAVGQHDEVVVTLTRWTLE